MSTAPVCPPMWQGSDAALVAELGVLETRLHSTWAQILSVVAEIDSRGPKPAETSASVTVTAVVSWPDDLDREAAEIIRAALSPLAAPRPTTDTEINLRTAAQRDADALVDLAQRSLQTGDLPTEAGERPQVVVTISLPVLQGRIGTAALAFGGPINAEVARRIACDARSSSSSWAPR